MKKEEQSQYVRENIDERVYECKDMGEVEYLVDAPYASLSLSGSSVKESVEAAYTVKKRNGGVMVVFINSYFMGWNA